MHLWDNHTSALMLPSSPPMQPKGRRPFRQNPLSAPSLTHRCFSLWHRRVFCLNESKTRSQCVKMFHKYTIDDAIYRIAERLCTVDLWVESRCAWGSPSLTQPGLPLRSYWTEGRLQCLSCLFRRFSLFAATIPRKKRGWLLDGFSPFR